MLPAENRLRNKNEFAQVFKKGRKSGNKILSVHVLDKKQGEESKPTQIGFVVSKKVGNSVIRHKVIRKLRHIMRENKTKINTQAVVIRAFPATATATYSDLEKALLKEFQKLGVLNEK